MKIRAKIYRPELLHPNTREAIHDGIDIVLAYMGQIAVQKSEIIINPLRCPNGGINPDRISFRKVDKLVELHLLAAPFKQPSEQEDAQKTTFGIAVFGEGFAAVDISSSASRLRTTTAHEVAHAFGYVPSDRTGLESSHHCSDSNCIMYFSAESIILDRPRKKGSGSFWNTLGHLPNLKSKLRNDVVDYSFKQYDFCAGCKADMYSTGESHVAKLRYWRISG